METTNATGSSGDQRGQTAITSQERRSAPSSDEGSSGDDQQPDPRAVCDRCDERISSNRYKCQDCPDFDYCSDCFPRASRIHPGHSFKLIETNTPGDAEETSEDEKNDLPDPSPPWKAGEATAFAITTPHKCRSCAPVTEPLAALRLILQDPKIPRKITLRWPLRLSRLIEATQSGCAFCCYCLNKFFGPTNGQFFAYRPRKPWYAEPSKHDKEREELVAHCMTHLKRLKRDLFEFHVNPDCTRRGAESPDIDRLEINLDKATEKTHVMKDLRGIFNSAGNIGVKLDVSTAAHDPAAAYLSSRPPNASPGSPEAIAQIKAWMKTCNEEHGSACLPQASSRLPTRLVDVSDPEMLRLYESAEGEQSCYITLSYCWGGAQEFCTKASTLADRIAGFSCQELPQTLQDAVKITRELGVRYLWVDSMCIVQDNEEDKAHQVSKMVDVYKNAYLTICAAGVDKVSEGFLGNHADPETGLWKGLIPMTYPIPNKEATTFQDAFKMPKEAVGTLLLMDEDVSFARTFSDDSVWKRGWCLQERVLSPRFLNYGRWPTWRCNREVWSDGGFYPEEAKVTLEERRLINNLLTLPDKGADLFTVNQVQNSWYKLVNNYTKRSLGLPEDRLPAIGGIAEQISRITGVEYMAGLWKNNLLHDLMWYADTRDWLTRPAEWRAPSWSWASVEAPIKYGGVTDDATPLAKVLECDVVPASQSTEFGQVSSGTVSINGPFAEIQRDDVLALFDSQNMSAPPPKSNDVSEWYRQMMEEIQNRPKVAVSKEDAEATLPDKVYGLITFTRDWTKQYESILEKTCYFGFLLREVEGGKYERIGSFFNETCDWLDQSVEPWAKRVVVLV